MRLGLVLREPFADDAALAESLGFELGWLDERATTAALVVAASLAGSTSDLRIGASIAAGPHPVTLAEEAAVADRLLAGRLVLGLESADEALLEETVDLLHHAFAARPFRHDGPRWRVPAGLPEHAADAALRVTPAPAQFSLPVWVAGPAGPAVAATRAVPFVTAGSSDAATGWSRVAAALGPAAARLSRPGLTAVAPAAGAIDTEQIVDGLLTARTEWGMDIAILELPPSQSPAQRAEALCTLAAEVRPRVQLASLPEGLEAWWEATPAETEGPS